MKDGFYLADEKHATIKGDVVEHKGVLYFRQSKSGFDGKATKDHVKENPALFEKFKKEHPEYELPAGFTDVVIGHAVASVSQPAPVEPEVSPAT